MRAINIYAALVAAVLVGLALAVAAEADEQPGPTPTPPPRSDIVLMPIQGAHPTPAHIKSVDIACMKALGDIEACSKEKLIEL